MKILRSGDVFTFRCEFCGCVFVEAAKKTRIADEGIYVPGYSGCGTSMECPECGNHVIGVRDSEKIKEERR